MEFSDEDLKWIIKCKTYPNLYKIYVDNDDIYVVDAYEEVLHDFENGGYDFIVQILNYIGCTADCV